MIWKKAHTSPTKPLHGRFLTDVQRKFLLWSGGAVDFRIVQAQQCVHIVLSPAAVDTMPAFRDELPLFEDLQVFLNGGDAE